MNDLKFLGINISNTLTWKSQIEKFLPKLSSACFALRSIKTPCFPTNAKSNILFPIPLNNPLWINVLGKQHIATVCLRSKRE